MQQPGLDDHGQRTRRLPPRQPFEPFQSFRPFTRFTIEIARATGSRFPWPSCRAGISAWDHPGTLDQAAETLGFEILDGHFEWDN